MTVGDYINNLKLVEVDNRSYNDLGIDISDLEFRVNVILKNLEELSKNHDPIFNPHISNEKEHRRVKDYVLLNKDAIDTPLSTTSAGSGQGVSAKNKEHRRVKKYIALDNEDVVKPAPGHRRVKNYVPFNKEAVDTPAPLRSTSPESGQGISAKHKGHRRTKNYVLFSQEDLHRPALVLNDV